jgi:hypothetical protein
MASGVFRTSAQSREGLGYSLLCAGFLSTRRLDSADRVTGGVMSVRLMRLAGKRRRSLLLNHVSLSQNEG